MKNYVVDDVNKILYVYCQYEVLKFQMRQHDAYILHASIYSIQGVENDVSAMIPNITSASCDIDL